jgi:hypothetical protein
LVGAACCLAGCIALDLRSWRILLTFLKEAEASC